MLLRVHVTSVLFLDNLPQLWASIGVTCSYSSHPFLCALALGHCTFWTRLWILIWKVRPLSVKARRLCEIWKSISDDPDVYFQAATCNSASMQGTLKVGNFRGGGENFCKFQGFKAPNLSSDSPQGQFVDQRRPSGGGGGGGYCAWRTIRLPVSVERYNYVNVKMGGEAGTFGGSFPLASSNLIELGWVQFQATAGVSSSLIQPPNMQSQTEVEYIVACFEHVSSMCCSSELQLKVGLGKLHLKPSMLCYAGNF